MATADQQLASGDESRGRGARGEGESSELPISLAKWQDLEARWTAILGMEAALDTLRISMEGLLAEIETLLKKALTIEEKTYALRGDVAQWERAKLRVHYALPKMKEFIHRAIWALGSPERKRLGELYRDRIQPQLPFPKIGEVLKQLGELQKDRQVLSALGKTVYQESRSMSAEIQGALRTLQNNANARRTKGATRSKRGFFK